MIIANANRKRIIANPVVYNLGLTAALISVPAQNSSVWILRSADISQYIGATARLVIRYLGGSSYTGDVQFDDFTIGSTFYDPNVGTNGFERNNVAGTISDYSLVTWSALTTATSGGGLFLRDTSGTSSGSTGLTSGHTGTYYYYAESSSPGYPSKYFWLRSPEVEITNGTLSFWSAQYGATCGAFEAYLDIIS